MQIILLAMVMKMSVAKNVCCYITMLLILAKLVIGEIFTKSSTRETFF